MPVVYLEIAINNSLKLDFIKRILSDWEIPGDYEEKSEILEALRGSIVGFVPYIKVYLFQVNNKLFGISGSKPDKAAISDPVGVFTYVNALKNDSTKVNRYLNDTNNFFSDDLLVNKKLGEALSGQLPTEDLWSLVKDAPAPGVPDSEHTLSRNTNAPVELTKENSSTKCDFIARSF